MKGLQTKNTDSGQEAPSIWIMNQIYAQMWVKGCAF